MTEAAVVRACVTELNARRILHFNVNGSNGTTGLPDRMAFPGHGITLAIEAKRPKGGRISAKQQYVHEQLRDAGIRVAVIRSRDELCKVLDEITTETRAA